MFEPKKYSDLFEALRSRIPPALTDFETGSVTRTLTESFAFEMALLYEKMNLVYLSAFVETAQGTNLDQVVSILGIRRGLPDFSSGTVFFLRDLGNEDIVIPLGTLVATEDQDQIPKKVYQTIEPATLAKNQPEAEVKVQAVQRGEEQDANAETIIVMPRPIPGIKAVLNKGSVKLTGKRRETDDELRERAKNTLISSGKATIVSIENAVLSLPGVLDARVKERFHFAEGEISVSKNVPADMTMPRGTTLGVGILPNRKSYRTKDDLQFNPGDNLLKVGITSTLEGNVGEAPSNAGLSFDDGAFASFNITNDKPISLGEFGVIDVYVDAKDMESFNNTDLQKAIRQEIDNVRAAGILALVKPAQQLQTNAVFRIEASPQSSLTDEAKITLENRVKDELNVFFKELRMGQPLLFSKLVKKTLSIEGVDNLVDFRLTTFKQVTGSPQRVTAYKFSDNKILIDEFEILKAQEICVAVDDKQLPISIEFKASGIMAGGVEGAVANAVILFFADKKQGVEVKKSELASLLSSIPSLGFELSSLKIKAQSWCERTVLTEGEGDIIVNTTFVEKPVPGNIFSYKDFLDLTGAVRLVLPLNLTQEAKTAVIEAAKITLTGYLDNLKAEEDIEFENLSAAMMKVEKVLAVELDKEDFRVALGGLDLPQRIDAKKIAMQKFEKIRASHFAVVADTEIVEVEISSLALQVLTVGASVSDILQLKIVATHTINSFLSTAAVGDDLIYNNLRSAVQNLVPDITYTISSLSIRAMSKADGREQTSTIATPNNIHVRSVELASIKAFKMDSIVIAI